MEHPQIMSSLVMCTRKFARPTTPLLTRQSSFFYNLKERVESKRKNQRKVTDSHLKFAGVTTLLLFT